MKTDIQIAQEATMLPITEIAEQVGLTPEDLEMYGKYKAKLSDECMERLAKEEDGKLVLVTAINPTPAGEGKTTTSVGLGQAFAKLGKKAVLALREPSLGPCFGIKGGAAGGGYAQVVPMEDLNLHFTGDFHAITSANNLLAALLDTLFNNLYGLIMGKIYNEELLGAYNRGDQFPKLIVNNLGAAIQAVLLPAFSSRQGDVAQVRSMVRRAIRTSSFLVLPMLFGLFAVADTMVLALLGETGCSREKTYRSDLVLKSYSGKEQPSCISRNTGTTGV